MLIQCTKKLLDEMKIKPVDAQEEPLFSWHANLITLNRKKAVVLLNDKNKYVIVLHGLKAKEFKNLDAHIKEAIVKTFREELIDEEIIEKFINQSKEYRYAKTKDRSLVGKLNKACDNAHFLSDVLQPDSLHQTIMGVKLSGFLISEGKKDYIYPNEQLYKDLEEFAGRTIFNCKAVQLKITLKLENREIWRRLIVPVEMSFKKFHRTIQETFGWMDYHLHEFYIYEASDVSSKSLNPYHPIYLKEGFTPIVNLISHDEAYDFPSQIPMIHEKEKKLSDYLPREMKYIYDFGDTWKHHIEVEEFIDGYDKNHPICLAGEGNTPPEDVGGSSGFEEFLEIIADSSHPEYKSMMEWGQSQGYRDFKLKQVNIALKDVW